MKCVNAAPVPLCFVCKLTLTQCLNMGYLSAWNMKLPAGKLRPSRSGCLPNNFSRAGWGGEAPADDEFNGMIESIEAESCGAESLHGYLCLYFYSDCFSKELLSLYVLQNPSQSVTVLLIFLWVFTSANTPSEVGTTLTSQTSSEFVDCALTWAHTS